MRHQGIGVKKLVYTQSPCAERNSSTPLTQTDINRQNLRMNRQVQPMLDGNSDMYALIASLTPPPPANTCDDFKTSKSIGPAYPWPMPGWNGGIPETAGAVTAAAAQAALSTSGATGTTAAGVATPPTAGSSPTPSGNPATGGPGWQPGQGGRGAQFGRGGRFSGPSGRNGNASPYFLGGGLLERLSNSIQNFSCPPAATKVIPVPVVSAPIPAVTTPAAPAAPASTCPPQSQCMTGNICLDLKRGCVAQSQLDPAQVLACAEAGYSGNENYFPCVIAQPNLPFIGSPLPNPPQYATVAAQDNFPGGNWGLSGLGCGGDGPGTFSGVIGIALGVAAGLFFADWLSKQRSFAA
jgi:hypothetical protein